MEFGEAFTCADSAGVTRAGSAAAPNLQASRSPALRLGSDERSAREATGRTARSGPTPEFVDVDALAAERSPAN